MPINPMQRRARNSFLAGFLIALVIMAVVVFLLLQKIKTINEAKEALEALQQDMYVATEDIESGELVTMESFKLDTVQTTVDPEMVVSEDDFAFYDEEGNIVPKYNEDGSEKLKELVMKINVPAGTIITKDMLVESDALTTDDQRIQEYNMILLPSQLKSGDYIDIRFSLPKGQDYIVLSKKKVLQCTSTGIWMKLSEDELLTLQNAIVESYTIQGSKLYAIEYSEPGLQAKAEQTYPVSQEVLELINKNPNVVETAKNALWERYNANEMAQAYQRNTYISPAVAANEPAMAGNVQSGNQQENGKVQAAREEYISTLEGEM